MSCLKVVDRNPNGGDCLGTKRSTVNVSLELRLLLCYRFGKMSESRKSKPDRQNNGRFDGGGGDMGM